MYMRGQGDAPNQLEEVRRHESKRKHQQNYRSRTSAWHLDNFSDNLRLWPLQSGQFIICPRQPAWLLQIGWMTIELTLPATHTFVCTDGSTCTINSSRWKEPIFTPEGCVDKSTCDEFRGEWTPDGQPVDTYCFDINQTNFGCEGSPGKTLSDCVQTEDKVIDGITYRCIKAICACTSQQASYFGPLSASGCSPKIKLAEFISFNLPSLFASFSLDEKYKITTIDPLSLFGISELKKLVGLDKKLGNYKVKLKNKKTTIHLNSEKEG